MPAAATSHPSTAPVTNWLPAFLVLAVMWGCSFAFITICLTAFTPVQVAFGRLAVGAVTLIVIAAITRTALPCTLQTWAHLAVVAALLNAVPFTLFTVGQQHVSSTLAAVINAATPLVTLLVIIAAFPTERPTFTRSAGFITGFVGILIVLGVWHTVPDGELGGIFACLTAVTCYGIAFPYSRKYLQNTGTKPIGLATGQVLLATGMLAVPYVVTGVQPVGALTPTVLWSMLALGAASSGVAYVLNFQVIDRAGAATASSVTYLTPVVAAIVGVAALGEQLAWHEPVGAVVVLLGVAISQGKLTRKPRPQ